MFLFILESIGTSELILIGIIALIFLGPRKLPQIAKTIGKTMADFRNTTNEFKSTWQREVDFEEELSAIRTIGDDEPSEADSPTIPRIETRDMDENTIIPPQMEPAVGPVAVRGSTEPPLEVPTREQSDSPADAPPTEENELSDKRTWL